MIRATARLQFHKDFTLDDGTALVPYLDRLGISHLYASPLLTARPGSTHGYDIVDHHRINPELGGMDALRRMVAALRAHGMGLI
ncbi:MAG TPA: alpha-amylase family glycosyl hydrolase, partial [Acidisphaera sp.]|nr:alpha-amylase family glycosyl hydrolase [Acidisphaera sp.]